MEESIARNECVMRLTKMLENAERMKEEEAPLTCFERGFLIQP